MSIDRFGLIADGDVRVVQHQQREHLQLKRKIDLPNGVAMIVGNMIGAFLNMQIISLLITLLLFSLITN